MRANLKRGGVVLGCSAGLFVTSMLAVPAARGAYISDDFQSDTAASAATPVAPASVTGTYLPGVTNGTTLTATTVDSSTTPADPFGGQGNKSLLLRDQDAAKNTAVWWTGATGGLQSGDLSLKLHQDQTLAGASYASTYSDIRIGKSLSTGSTGTPAVLLAINAGSATLTTATLKLDNVALANTLTLGANHTLTLHFDLSGSGSVSGQLDGVDLATSGGTKSFGLNASVTDVDSVMFVAGWSSPDGVQVFYDDVNLSAVPEPGTLSLLGLGAMGLLSRRRRRMA